MNDKKESETSLIGTFFFVLAVGSFIVAGWTFCLNFYLDQF
ncbi:MULTISPECIES: hypothetical protein [Rummeliibacillus]|nr:MULTISPECIES: hypothetical protein [Rummeliibacillus]MBB5170638.1 hypothetical protein [Rummeliibacillus stabekisii]